MKEGVAAQKPIQTSNDVNPERKSPPDLRADRVSQMRSKVSGIGGLRMSVETPRSTAPSFDEEIEPVMTLSPADATRPEGRGAQYWLAYGIAGFLTAMWLSFCVLYATNHAGSFAMTPSGFGSFLTGAFAPPALFWLVANTMNRRADVEHYSLALRSELHRLLFPNDASESIINTDVQRLVQQASEISASSRAVMKSLQRARHGLRMEVRDYAGVSKKTEFHIDRLAEGLHERSAKLLELTTEIEHRTSQIDAKTQAGAEAWDNATQKILERAGTIESAMGTGADKILAAADRADEKARNLQSHMTKSYEALNSAVDIVSTRLGDLTSRFDGQVEGLTEVETRLSTQADSLGTVITTKVEDLKEITDNALLAMARSSETIKDQKEGFDRSAKVFADQARQIGEIVATSVGGLNEAVDHMISKGVSFEERLSTRTQELRGFVGELGKEAEAIERASTQAAAKLDESLAVATAGSEAIHGSVRRAADLIETSVKTSRKNIEELSEASDKAAQKLVTSVQDIENATAKTKTQFKEVDAALEERMDSLNANSDHAVRAISNANTALEGSVSRLQSAAKTIEHARAETVSSSDAVAEKLQTLGASFEERLGKFRQETQDILKELEQAGTTLNGATDNIGNNASIAYEKISSLAEVLSERQDDLHKLTEQLKSRVAEIKNTMEEQMEDLTSSAGLAVAMIGESGNEFVRQAKIAEGTAERVAAGFERAGIVAREESELLSKSSDLACQRATRQAGLLRDELQSLLNNSGALGDLKDAGDVLSQRAAEFAQKMQETLQVTQSYNKELKVQAMNAVEASRESAETLSRAVDTLNEKTQDIGKIADDTSAKIKHTQDGLRNESERLIAVSSAALESARNATMGFGKQSESLFKAAQDAEERVKGMRGLEERAKRETFMDTARFTLEKLHSLSIDLTRQVEGDVPEKNWKAYQGGDVGAFTRRLAELKGEVPMDRARAKFIKDAEFRAYVQRFIRQFEDLYLQAVESDHASIMSSTLASSDVGKVYVFLCAVAGVKPRFNEGTLKAA